MSFRNAVSEQWKGGAALAGLILAVLARPALAAPKAELWPRWTAHNEHSTLGVDYSAWNRFLKRYLHTGYPDGINRVAYSSVSAEDKAALGAFLNRLQAVPVDRLTRARQRAYWTNLYNATTVKVVLDHYPVKSILDIDISPGWFTRGPWGKKLLKVDGVPVSLNDIEHRILRPIWRDPRTHYSVNCASLGCPNLQPRAFTADHMEAMLDSATRAYVNSPRGARVVRGRLIVSSIYVWFQADFGGSDAGVIAHLKRYAAPPLLKQLAGIRRIADDHYDWSLNDAR